MAKTNPNYDRLAAGYLFPEIARRLKAFQEANPGVGVFRLGVGNTTEPLPTAISSFMEVASYRLSVDPQYPLSSDAKRRGMERVFHEAGYDKYTGYGDEQGNSALRKAIAGRYAKRGVALSPLEIFVSDGAKTDSANIGSIFAQESIVAVQDPAYPVYVDSNVIAGRTGGFVESRYRGLVYMPCTEENGFMPEPPKRKVDLIYLCSPNNPTGAVLTKEQIKKFVDYAIENKAVIIFDAAYAAYISNSELPRSVYEVEGARQCAIEINSFSKDAGFTGVRLGWAVVPNELVVEGTEPGKVNALWNRRQTTMFNGASNIAQAGGLGVLTEDGQRACKAVVDFYMENARIIREGIKSFGLKVFGGVNAPYIWMQTPGRMKSWDFFDKLLKEAHVVCTPGAGFGPTGEGYARFSAFGHRPIIEDAVQNIKSRLRL